MSHPLCDIFLSHLLHKIYIYEECVKIFKILKKKSLNSFHNFLMFFILLKAFSSFLINFFGSVNFIHFALNFYQII